MQEEDAMVLADVSGADIFWSMLEFFFLFIWILILFHILGDVAGLDVVELGCGTAYLSG